MCEYFYVSILLYVYMYAYMCVHMYVLYAYMCIMTLNNYNLETNIYLLSHFLLHQCLRIVCDQKVGH